MSLTNSCSGSRTYLLDADARVTARITEFGIPAAPDDVQATIWSPSGDVLVLTLVDDALTELIADLTYALIVDLDEVGTWVVRIDALDSGDNIIGSAQAELICVTPGPINSQTTTVNSVNGQTGTVTLDADQLPYDNDDSGLSAVTVQDALDELDEELRVTPPGVVVSQLWSVGNARYEWLGGVTPWDGWSNIQFIGPEDPSTAANILGSPRGNVAGDTWIDTSS
jgi:hypothetical protein